MDFGARLDAHLNVGRRFIEFWLLLATAHFYPCSGQALDPSDQTKPSPDRFGNVPIAFEENRGQGDPSVHFLARMGSGAVFLTGEGAIFRSSGQSLTLRFAGGRKPQTIEGLEPTGGTSSYFFGTDSASWRTSIPNFSSVRYRRVYDGIDLVFRGRGRSAEYDFIVSPGADLSMIEMDFPDAKILSLTPTGDLVASVDGFEVVHRKPAIYQTHAGARREIDGSFVLRGKTRVAFRVGEYDRTEALVIDPVIAYSALIVGSGGFVATAIAVDTAGNAYVAGDSGGTAFVYKLNPSGTTLLYSATVSGVSANAIAVDSNGNAYVAGGNGHVAVFKLNPTGSALLYSYSFGGTYTDSANGIAIDSGGNAYVAGLTSSQNFPTTTGALRTTTATVAGTGFVAKVNPAGTGLVYSTFLGGNGTNSFAEDVVNAIAIDSAGNAYVTGTTTSSDFPVTSGSFQTDGSGDALGNGFITKLNPAGSALIYSTLLEGGVVSGNGIAVDAAGNAYVAGSSDYLTIPNVVTIPSVPVPSGMFVLKLNPSGTAPVYVSLIGSNQGSANAIAIDLAGNSYVTGWTASSSFPVVAPIQAFAGTAATVQGANTTKSAVIVELDPSGNTLFSTYLGGQNNGDWGNGIAAGPNGTAYVAGRAGSFQFPVTPGAAGNAAGNGFDAFVTAINTRSSCSFSLLPTASSFAATGGSGSVDVLTQASCDWIAISNQPWITVTGGASGSGPGTVNYTVAPSIVPARAAPMSIAGVLNSVSQANGCTYSLSSNGVEVPAAGAMVTVSLATGLGCTYTASTPPSWILQEAGYPYSGSTQWIYNVTANTGNTPRSATLTLAGLPFVINQDGGYTCSFTVGPNASYSALPWLGSVQVTTTNTCSWSAVSNTSWLFVDLVASGSGNDPTFGTGSGFVNYHMGANPGPLSRTGTITVAGQTFTVIQAAPLLTTSPVIPTLDINGDGFQDVFLYDPVGGTGYAGLSNGSGAFTYIYNAFSPGFDTIRYGNFNRDGLSDLIAYNSTSTLGYTLLGGTITFSSVSLFWGPGFTKVAAGDLNGDGLTDFVIYRPSDGTSYTAISNGDGTFHYQYALVSIGFTHMVVADFNGDGKADIFFYRSTDGLAYLGIGNGTGGFTFSPVTVGPAYSFIEAGDINGDGKADLLLYASSSGATAVGLSTGSGFTFTPYSYSAGFTTVKLFDFNGDGKADVALYNMNNTLGYLGISNGTGNFTFSSLFWGAGMSTVDALDLNGDGKIDIVIYNTTNGASYTGISSGNPASPFTYQYSYWGNGKVLATAAAQP
jgi:hypothetical protein